MEKHHRHHRLSQSAPEGEMIGCAISSSWRGSSPPPPGASGSLRLYMSVDATAAFFVELGVQWVLRAGGRAGPAPLGACCSERSREHELKQELRCFVPSLPEEPSWTCGCGWSRASGWWFRCSCSSAGTPQWSEPPPPPVQSTKVTESGRGGESVASPPGATGG